MNVLLIIQQTVILLELMRQILLLIPPKCLPNLQLHWLVVAQALITVLPSPINLSSPAMQRGKQKRKATTTTDDLL